MSVTNSDSFLIEDNYITNNKKAAVTETNKDIAIRFITGFEKSFGMSHPKMFEGSYAQVKIECT